MNIVELENCLIELVGDVILNRYDCSCREFTLTTPPPNIDADYAIACFNAAKILKKSPQMIAQEIISHFKPVEWLADVSAQGPYVNFRLEPAFLCQTVIHQALASADEFGKTSLTNPRTVLIEYSSPNTNKPLHLGHIRNNVLGMAIVNLLTSQGHHVIPASIMNDRGIHICKAMVAYTHFFLGKTPKTENMKGDHFVGQCYVAFELAAKSNSELLEESRQLLREWEAGNTEVHQLWEQLNSWVYEGFNETYTRLGSLFDLVQYESETYKLGRKIVENGLSSNVFYKQDDGSIWVDLTDTGLDHKALLRADGTSLYVTQDLGVAVERFRKYHLDQVIYVVASEQNYHFNVLFELFRRLGYDWWNRCYHLNYGMVYLPEGKMKSREGKVVDADTLMDQMKLLALEVMEDSRIAVDYNDKDSIAEAIGTGAIKYYILKVNPSKDIHFDPKESLSFEGATGAYIQYTYARIQSVYRKSHWSESLLNFDASALSTLEELNLVRTLLRYPGVLKSAAEELNPAKVCMYLWELAKAFNGFYHKHRIIDAESDSLRKARLALAVATGYGIRSGLTVLGIKPLDRM
ncbi:arginine--tRNA ligase [bacterium]|nr:arginine--tRNA ligase [candidate division CSSED10-310 bacterium]